MAHTGSRHVDEPDKDKSQLAHVLVRVVAVFGGFALLVAGAVVVLGSLGADPGDQAPAARPTCAAHTLRVSVDPAIEDAVLAATTDLSEFAADRTCLAVQVDVRSSAVVAAELSRPKGVGLATPLPDAWLPDSSVWIGVARRTASGAARLTQTPQSVATSPLVLAVGREQAEAAGWPSSQPTWASMLEAPITQWRLGIPDPQSVTAGLAALVAVGRRSAAFSTLGRRLELPPTTERSPAQIVADGDLDAMPTTEYDVARTAEAGGEVVASYDERLGGSLDFPLIGITPDDAPVDDRVAADLAVLMEALRAPSTQASLTAAGLRTADGELAEKYVGADGSPDLGVLPGQTGEPFQAGPAKVARTLRTWSSVGRRSRLLILLDVSGSMQETLPTGEQAKIDLARRSLSELVATSALDSDLGLWTFTTGDATDGTNRIVDVGQLGEELNSGQTRRERLTEVVQGLTPVEDGGTPLYRAVLAAYASALDNYALGRYNAVLVVTDGRDEDDTQEPIPAAEVIDQLRRQYDGRRRVEIISLAYGQDVDFDVLEQMAEVTGGAAYQGLTQNQVTKMLSDALARRP